MCETDSENKDSNKTHTRQSFCPLHQEETQTETTGPVSSLDPTHPVHET